jgi:UDP-N-acetylglucosamine 2-epimerase (non-hydrolysing)
MMKPLRVLSVFGTRPEAVKMAPIIRALRQAPGIEALVCVTAQHREMLDQVLELFEIVPDVDLDLMQPNQSLAGITAEIFIHLDPVLKQIKPDWVLVQGDTTTVMAASLLAYYNQIRIGHVEAGLRTQNKWQPFPEEVNRRIAGVVADLHFAPTEWSRQNLLREGIPSEIIQVTGNPVIDALNYVIEKPLTHDVKLLLDQLGMPIDPESTPKQRFILVTAHRRENFGQPLIDICTALLKLVEIFGDAIQIIYPVHLNPNVQEPVYRLLGNSRSIHLLPPLDYLPLVQVLKRSYLVLTDSGGIQEEAPGLGKPVLVLRNVTERPEGVEAGTVRIVGTNLEKIVAETSQLLNTKEAYLKMAHAVNPYGDGRAAGRIVTALLAKAAEA